VEKFFVSRPKIAKKIILAGSPEAVKKISNQNKDKVLPAWYDERVAAMEQILKAKARQHEDVREMLKRTGNRTIVENSPVDNFWGIGPDGKGENVVGKIWMKIRDNL